MDAVRPDAETRCEAIRVAWEPYWSNVPAEALYGFQISVRTTAGVAPELRADMSGWAPWVISRGHSGADLTGRGSEIFSGPWNYFDVGVAQIGANGDPGETIWTTVRPCEPQLEDFTVTQDPGFPTEVRLQWTPPATSAYTTGYWVNVLNSSLNWEPWIEGRETTSLVLDLPEAAYNTPVVFVLATRNMFHPDFAGSGRICRLEGGAIECERY